MSNQSTLNEFGGSDTNGQVGESDPGDGKLYRNEEWLREQYCENELTQKEIAGLTNVTRHTISNWLERHDIERRSLSETKTEGNLEKLADEEWLRKQYCENGLGQREIAELADVSKQAVSTWMNKHGIDRRSTGRQADGDTEPLKDEEWLREQYCENELSQREIADKLGVSAVTVGNWMRRHEIESRSPAESHTNGNLEPLRNRKWLQEQYHDQKKTTRQIADGLGVSRSPVERCMHEHGIEFRSSTEARTDGNVELLKNEGWLREQYCERGRTMEQIADEVGVSVYLVRKWMQEHEIDRRSPAESQVDGDLELLDDEEWLREQYYEREKTLKEIADEVGLSEKTVRNRMKRYDIERRSPVESRVDGDLELLDDEEWLREQYCDKEKTTYEIADEVGLSRSVVTKRLKRHDIEIRSSIMHPDHLPHRVIGELELDIANLLNDAGVDYTYESREIEYGEGRRYTPDFVTEDYVIECKGADWGKKYDKGYTAEQKAEAIMKQLDEREYVVVGIQLPCDIHIPREEHGTIQELFE